MNIDWTAVAVAVSIAAAFAVLLALWVAAEARASAISAHQSAEEARKTATQAEISASAARRAVDEPLVARQQFLPTVRSASKNSGRHVVPEENYVERTAALTTVLPKTPREEIVPLRVRPGGPPAAVVVPSDAAQTLLGAALLRGQELTEADWTGERAGARR